MPEPLTPGQVRKLEEALGPNDWPPRYMEPCDIRRLIATVDALREALRYIVPPGSFIAEAPVVARVAAWLEKL